MRRERLLFAAAIAVAVVLVLVRSVVPTLYEGFYFDSDQAIVGLMAKHLSTLHDVPLYYYGLNYLLGVQAWIIAPFFWLFRPTVAVMRMPLIALNIGVAVWLVLFFSTRLKLSPVMAFVATLPFLIPTPSVGGHLLEAAGASIEPFVYVLLLWHLRRRPFVFGLVLAVGFMHREFTIFALPALLLVEAAAGELWTWTALRRAGWAGAGVALAYLAVDDLKMHLTGSSVALQAASLGGQTCLDPRHLAASSRALLTEALPVLFGGRAMALSAFRMDTPVVAGSALVGWIVAAALALMVARLATGPRRPATRSATAARLLSTAPLPTAGVGADAGFGVYLACVGVCAACAYPLSCNVMLGAPPLLRYLLLALLLPVGCAAAYMQRETSRTLRTLIASAFVVWGALNLFDTVSLIRASIVDPPSNERRVLTDYLLEHRIRYARAIYWDAYVVDFLSRERVIVASVDLVRIPEYQKTVEEHADAAVNLARLPCSGGEQVASWCVQKD